MNNGLNMLTEVQHSNRISENILGAWATGVLPKNSGRKIIFETCQKKIIHEPVWLDQDKSSFYTEMPFHLSFLSQYSSQDQIKYDRSCVFLFVQLKGIPPKRFWKF